MSRTIQHHMQGRRDGLTYMVHSGEGESEGIRGQLLEAFLRHGSTMIDTSH